MNSYSEKGLTANHVANNDQDTLSLTYNGLLYNSGSDVVYVHYGYGTKWTKKETVQMKKTKTGFKIDIPLAKTGTINMAFKDSSENWDNNNGSDYSFSLRARK
ncbi:MAG: carbohydrate binding domain-containing protein [Deltaproteobacteria bacterium]